MIDDNNTKFDGQVAAVTTPPAGAWFSLILLGSFIFWASALICAMSGLGVLHSASIAMVIGLCAITPFFFVSTE